MFFAVIVGMTIIGTCTIPIKDLFESEQDVCCCCDHAIVAAVLLIYSGVSAKERVRVKKINLNLKKFFQLFQKIKPCYLSL